MQRREMVSNTVPPSHLPFTTCPCRPRTARLSFSVEQLSKSLCLFILQGFLRQLSQQQFFCFQKGRQEPLTPPWKSPNNSNTSLQVGTCPRIGKKQECAASAERKKPSVCTRNQSPSWPLHKQDPSQICPDFLTRQFRYQLSSINPCLLCVLHIGSRPTE